MILAWILIAGLAVYKVARAIASEEGPFSIFLRWRDHLGQGSWIGRGFNCVSCLSFWGGLFAALLIGPQNWRELLLMWGAVGGIATILWRYFG